MLLLLLLFQKASLTCPLLRLSQLNAANLVKTMRCALASQLMSALNVTPSAQHFPPKNLAQATACAFTVRSTVRGMLEYSMTIVNASNPKARICVDLPSVVWGELVVVRLLAENLQMKKIV